MYDCVVVGLGPAGSTAAYVLAKGGARVLALDKETFPRYKSCGGCISTKVEGLLGFDISPVVEDTVYGAGFTYKAGRYLDILSDEPVGYNVMRDRFDAFLVKKAAEAGAEIVDGTRVTGISEEDGSVTVTTAGGGQYKARFLIGADGAGGFIGRDYFGFNPREAAVSITAEVPYDRAALADRVTGRLFIDFGTVPYGYGWIFPKEKYLSVGIAGDAVKARGRVKEYFTNLVGAHEILNGLEVTERVGWTVPIFYDSNKPVVKGRVVLAGDTGHLVDPFLGEGIYYAIRTAREAATAVAGCLEGGPDGLSAYTDWLSRELYPEFEAADRISELIYSHPRLWYSMLERDPGIMVRYFDVIRGTESSKTFYEWVFAKVKTKPWRVLRSLIASRFIPS